MASFDNSYSRLVAWLKILFPLTALAILSSLFLVSRSPVSPISRPVPEQASADASYTPHISGPSLSGVTENGTRYTLGADLAVQDENTPENLLLTKLAGTFADPRGFSVDITAPTGTIFGGQSSALLSNGVHLSTSNGYEISAITLEADLKQATIFSPGTILATGPIGELSAGQMILRQQNTASSTSTYDLIFTKGVKVLYQP